MIRPVEVRLIVPPRAFRADELARIADLSQQLEDAASDHTMAIDAVDADGLKAAAAIFSNLDTRLRGYSVDSVDTQESKYAGWDPVKNQPIWEYGPAQTYYAAVRADGDDDTLGYAALSPAE